MLGVPPNTLPLVITNIHRDILLLVIITLQHVIQNNCRWVKWCFLMVWSTFWRSRKFLTNLPKLSCGFKVNFLNASLKLQESIWISASHVRHAGFVLHCAEREPDGRSTLSVKKNLSLLSSRIWTTPHQDNSPLYRYWSWWIVYWFVVSWSGVVLKIVILVGNSWALFISGGESSPVGSCLRTL